MIVGGPFTLSELTAAFRYHGRQWDAAAKRRRVAARLAEVQRRTVYWFVFRCAGCDDMQAGAPVYADWECGNCEYTGMVRP